MRWSGLSPSSSICVRMALNIVSGATRSFLTQASAIASGVTRSIQATLRPNALAPQASQRVGQRVLRDDREVLIAAHQRAQPGVFELLDAPDLRDDLAVAGKRRFGDSRHRLNVVQRAIGVEYDGFDAHLLCSFPPI